MSSTTTATTSTTAPDAGRPATTGLARRTGLAAVLAAGGNLVLSQVLAAVVDADPDFLGLQAGPVAAASAVGVLMGLAALLVLRRVRRERLFVPLVAVGALLSVAGPLDLLDATQAEQPGISDGAALALIPLHLLVGVVVALVLPRRTR